jgi:hypothetical protein
VVAPDPTSSEDGSATGPGPQDMAAELSVLSSMLIPNGAIADVTESIRGADVFRPAHGTIDLGPAGGWPPWYFSPCPWSQGPGARVLPLGEEVAAFWHRGRNRE